MSAARSPEGGDPAALSTTRARLSALLGDRRRQVGVLGVCAVASGLAEAGILALMAAIATSAVSGGSRVRQALGPLSPNVPVKNLFIAAFILLLIRIALQVPLAIVPSRIASGVQARLRRDLFDAFTRASWAVQSADREGHLQETMTSQVLQATSGALQATQLVITSFTFLLLMATAVALNALAALIVLVASMVLFGLLRPLNVLASSISRKLSKAQLEYAGGINEASRLAEETRVFGVDDAQRKRMNRRISAAQELFFRNQVVARISPSLYQSAIYLILFSGLAALYSTGRVHFASLGAVVLLIVRAGTYGQSAQGAYQGLRQSLPFIERLQDAIQRYASSAPPDGTQPLASVETLAFERLSFAYRPGRPVLREISFEVDAGEAVGIIGPSGAGKSTLVQILLQLRGPDDGGYLVNGVAAHEFVRADWHRRIAYVPQQPRVLHASVAENIRYFRDLDDETVERAGQLARIHDDVMSWSEGYETVIGPRADAVSGGQQQRICLARALAARPQVLVLDEPTSALDPHSETLIQESLSGLRHELTLFIIAHRMSTLDICDRVMVIIDGRMVAFEPTELLQQNNSYFRNASTIAAGTLGRTSS
jgi:ABC-type multidrug transport system fused ATPase/permease subunit